MEYYLANKKKQTIDTPNGIAKSQVILFEKKLDLNFR